LKAYRVFLGSLWSLELVTGSGKLIDAQFAPILVALCSSIFLVPLLFQKSKRGTMFVIIFEISCKFIHILQGHFTLGKNLLLNFVEGELSSSEILVDWFRGLDFE